MCSDLFDLCFGSYLLQLWHVHYGYAVKQTFIFLSAGSTAALMSAHLACSVCFRVEFTLWLRIWNQPITLEMIFCNNKTKQCNLFRLFSNSFWCQKKFSGHMSPQNDRKMAKTQPSDEHIKKCLLKNTKTAIRTLTIALFTKQTKETPQLTLKRWQVCFITSLYHEVCFDWLSCHKLVLL